MTRVLALRHVAFEDLGLLEPTLRRRGAGIRYWDAGRSPPAELADAEPDLLVAPGGPSAPATTRSTRCWARRHGSHLVEAGCQVFTRRLDGALGPRAPAR